MDRDCGTDDEVLIAICESVAENLLILTPASGLIDRSTTLGERPT